MNRGLWSWVVIFALALASYGIWQAATDDSAEGAVRAESYVMNDGPAPADRPAPELGEFPAREIERERLEHARKGAAESSDERRYEIGVIVDVDASKPLDWTEVPDAAGASRWIASIRSEGAAFVRPHFAVSPRALGYAVRAWGDDDRQVQDVVDRRQTPTEPGAWGALTFGDTTYLEVIAARAPADLRVDRVVHGDVDFRIVPKVQNCHLDPTCYDEYADVQSAIALITVGSGFSQWLCTGNLLADTAQTGQPWLLTANHCMGDQGEAESLVAYFRYETSVCNGSVPPLQTTPATSGSDFKASNNQSDYALVLLHEQPPAGTVALGWTTEPLDTDEPLSVVHHPAGSWKRIAFGFEDGDWGNKWNVGYTEANTEQGSSGSALLNSDRLVVGQLSTGTSYCWWRQGTDQFGKFSRDYDLGASEFLNNGEPSTTTTTTIPPDDDTDDDADDDDDWYPDDDQSGDDDAQPDDDASGDDDSGDDDDDDGGCGC
ncbi:MAG: trypsin-like peptidase domain-containing protein [Deltaproteobacteria bacterium]|nr:trypsin-like peptidase domain-containing protein [Deltaproteobacteria bacterium]